MILFLIVSDNLLSEAIISPIRANATQKWLSKQIFWGNFSVFVMTAERVVLNLDSQATRNEKAGLGSTIKSDILSKTMRVI